MVKLVNGVHEGHISWVLSTQKRPVYAMHPEEVNVLQLNLSTFLIENGEIGMELSLRLFCTPLLSIDEWTTTP
jgi:hypothetical protein